HLLQLLPIQQRTEASPSGDFRTLAKGRAINSRSLTLSRMADRLIAASSAYKVAPAFIHALLPLLRSFSMGNPVNNAVKGSGVPHASLFSRERRDWVRGAPVLQPGGADGGDGAKVRAGTGNPGDRAGYDAAT